MPAWAASPDGGLSGLDVGKFEYADSTECMASGWGMLSWYVENAFHDGTEMPA